MVNLDIVVGQTVSCYGYNCIVRSVDYNAGTAMLDFPNGEIRKIYFSVIGQANPDLVVLEEDWVENDDRHPEDYEGYGYDVYDDYDW